MEMTIFFRFKFFRIFQKKYKNKKIICFMRKNNLFQFQRGIIQKKIY